MEARIVTDSTRRCDYAVDGALGLGAAVAALGIAQGRAAEQLAYTVPVGLGLGWLWGRLLMPRRSHCRFPGSDAGTEDSTSLRS